MAPSLKMLLILFIKKWRIMKNGKLKSGFQALVASGLVIFFVACNNSDYTRNAPENNAPGSDTAMNNSAGTDTTSSTSKMNSPSTAMKSKTNPSAKKGKVTVGSMTSRKTSSMKPDKEGVYERTDVSPAYPGGQSALADYINNHIEYPQEAIDNSSEGTVDVQFVVDENGKVTNAKVIGNKLNNGLDEEAVRVVSDLPKWTPGKVKGKDVKTRIVLPITYKIEG